MKSGSAEAKARINSTFVLNAWGYTGSAVVAAQVPSFTFSTSAALSNTTYLVVNGVTYTQSATVNAADVQLVAGTNGKGTITVQTVGFADGNTVSFTVAAENDDSTYTVHVQDIDWTVARTAGNFLNTTPGTAVSVVFDVEDQFEVCLRGLPDQNSSDQCHWNRLHCSNHQRPGCWR